MFLPFYNIVLKFYSINSDPKFIFKYYFLLIYSWESKEEFIFIAKQK